MLRRIGIVKTMRDGIANPVPRVTAIPVKIDKRVVGATPTSRLKPPVATWASLPRVIFFGSSRHA